MVLAIINSDHSGTGLLEVIKEQTNVWDCLNVRFHWDLAWKGEHGVGIGIPRQGT